MLRCDNATIPARELQPGDIIRLTGARVAEVEVRDAIVRVRFRDEWFEHPVDRAVEVCRGVVL